MRRARTGVSGLEKLEERLAFAETRITTLDACVTALLAGGGGGGAAGAAAAAAGDVGPDPDPEAAVPPARKSTRIHVAEQETSSDRAYKLKPSTWDSLILLFIPSSDTSLIDSMLASGLLLTNVVVQTALTVIIFIQAMNLSRATGGEQFHEDAREWRAGIGHHVQHYDPVTQTSLVTRVCTGYGAEVIAQEQMEVHGAIRDYLKGANDFSIGTGHGPILSFLAVLMWTVGIGKELRQIWEFSSAVLTMESGPTVCLAEMNSAGERQCYSFQTLSHSRRVVLVLEAAVRSAIAVSLWYSGMLWLTYTVEMNEIILNAVALGYVLEADELLYHLIPKDIDIVLKNLEPMPMRQARGRHRCFNSFDWRSSALVILLIVMMIVWNFTWNKEFQEQLDTSLNIFCGGDTNFVYEEEPTTHVVNTARTLSDEVFESSFKLETSSRRHLYDAVWRRTGIEGGGGGPLELVEGISITEVVQLSLREVANSIDRLECSDAESASARNGMWSRLNGTDNCTDAQERFSCNDWRVRLFCPRTCGCHSVAGGLFDRYGCTSQCDSMYEESVAVAQVVAIDRLGEDYFPAANWTSGAANWTQARAKCEGLNMQLAAPRSEVENQEVADAVPGGLDLASWLNYRYNQNSGRYIAADGQELPWTPSGHGNPDDYYSSDVYCVRMRVVVSGEEDVGIWREELCGQELPFVCEVPARDVPLEHGGAVLGFVAGLELHLLDEGHIDRSSMFSEEFSAAFRGNRSSEISGWEVDNSTVVNITQWVSLALEQNARSCEWALYLDALFETNMCEGNLTNGFGTLAPFCPMTCGWHGSRAPPVGTHVAARGLEKLLGHGVIKPWVEVVGEIVVPMEALCDWIPSVSIRFEGEDEDLDFYLPEDFFMPITVESPGRYTFRLYSDHPSLEPNLVDVGFWTRTPPRRLLEPYEDGIHGFTLDLASPDEILFVVSLKPGVDVGSSDIMGGGLRFRVECPLTTSTTRRTTATTTDDFGDTDGGQSDSLTFPPWPFPWPWPDLGGTDDNESSSTTSPPWPDFGDADDSESSSTTSPPWPDFGDYWGLPPIDLPPWLGDYNDASSCSIETHGRHRLFCLRRMK